jgi:hypothetical protein
VHHICIDNAHEHSPAAETYNAGCTENPSFAMILLAEFDENRLATLEKAIGLAER